MVSRLIEEAPALPSSLADTSFLKSARDQEAPVRALIEGQPGLKLAPTVYDHAKHPRVIRAHPNAS